MAKAADLKTAFPFLAAAPGPGVVPSSPASPEVSAVPAKPIRTVGNIYSAIRAQAIFNPGQPTPADPDSGTSAPGPIGSNAQNQTIKGPPGKQVDTGTAPVLAPKDGWAGGNATG